MSDIPNTTPDKRALLNELKIDRSAPQASKYSPLKWMLLIAVVAGSVFALWYFPGAPAPEDLLLISTVQAQSSSSSGRSETSLLDATGYVVARRQATVSAKTTGKVVEVLIEEGMRVEEGQLLAQLDDSIPRAQHALADSQLQASQAALAELRVQIKQAELDLERTQGLAERNLASQADLDRDGLTVDALLARLQRAQREIAVSESGLAVQAQLLSDMQIRAPFSGIVIAKAAQPGEMISPISAGGGFTRTGICTIVDMASLEIEVDVNEAYINRVRADQPVRVTLNAYPDQPYAARVIAIIPAADRNKATVRVRVGLLEQDDRVLPDMGVRVAFLEDTQPSEAPSSADTQPSAVVLPSASVHREAGVAVVWMIDDDKASKRRVLTGESIGTRVRILSGVEPGDRVVANVTQDLSRALDSGAKFRVANP